MLRQRKAFINACKSNFSPIKNSHASSRCFSAFPFKFKSNGFSSMRTNLYTLINETEKDSDYDIENHDLGGSRDSNLLIKDSKTSVVTPLNANSSSRYADLHLFSLDKNTRAVTANWAKVGEALQKHMMANEYQRVIEIANRIETTLSTSTSQDKSELLPPMPIIDLILRSLAQIKSIRNSSNLVAPLSIKILERVIQKSLVPNLTEVTLKSIAMSISWITQPFFRYALIDLLEKCVNILNSENSSKSEQLEKLLTLAQTNSYMNSGDIESCLLVFKNSILSGYPNAFDSADITLSKALTKTGDVKLLFNYYQMTQNEYEKRTGVSGDPKYPALSISSSRNDQHAPLIIIGNTKIKSIFHKSTILKLFDSAVQARESEIVALLWKKSVIPQQIEPSDAQLKTIMEVFSEEELGQVYGEVFRKLSLRNVQDIDNFDISSILNNAAETEKLQQAGFLISSTGHQLSDPELSDSHSSPVSPFLSLLELCSVFVSNIDYKLFDSGFDALWRSYTSHNKDPWGFSFAFTTRIPQTRNESQDNQPKNSQIGIGPSDASFKTFKINCLLRTVLRNWGTRATFAMYRDLFRQGEFVPNVHTFEELAFAGLLLRNSKLLGKAIYNECLELGIRPSQTLYELLIRAASRGKNPSAAYYYLSQIAQGRIDTIHSTKDSGIYSNQQLMENITSNVRPSILSYLQRQQFKHIKEPIYKQFISSPQKGIIKFSKFPSVKELSNSSASAMELQGTFSASYNYNLDRIYALNFKEGWPKDKVNPPKDLNEHN